MNHDIIEQQLTNIDKRLKLIEDKYPTVEPEYIEKMAAVMKKNNVARLSVGQICIEVEQDNK